MYARLLYAILFFGSASLGYLSTRGVFRLLARRRNRRVSPRVVRVPVELPAWPFVATERRDENRWMN